MSTETKKEKKLRNYKIKKALLISGIALLAVQLVDNDRCTSGAYTHGRNDNPEVGTAGNYNKDYITSFIRRAYCGFCVS